MMTTTDTIVLVLFFLFAAFGWRKGLVRALTGPVATVVCFWYGYRLFHATGHWGMPLLIAIGGPIAVSALVSAMLFLLGVAKGGEGPSLSSRLAGSIVNLCWSGSMVLLIVLVIGLFPRSIFGLSRVQNDVRGSRTFTLLSEALFGVRPVNKESPSSRRMPVSIAQYARLRHSPEYRELEQDKRVQAVLHDTQLMAKIRSGNWGPVMEDPKILAIMRDPALAVKFLRFQRLLYQQSQQGGVAYQLPSAQGARQ